VLGSLGAIGVASAGAGFGTSAYFSDEESFDDNILTAGELDLKLDWQEHYNGSLIEAYPDPDDDGEQESFASAPGETVTYDTDGGAVDVGYVCEDGANTGEDLDPRTGLRTENDDTLLDSGPAPLIRLGDVKPGDSGEVTFSLHLCDNPGYIWWTGALTENDDNGLTDPESEVDDTDGAGEGELADAIQTELWYDSGPDGEWNPEEDDAEGDNVRQPDEQLIARGSLSEVLARLDVDPGLPLDANPGTASDNEGTQSEGPEPTSTQTEHVVSEDGEGSPKLNCTTVGGNPDCSDYGLFRAIKLDDGENLDTGTFETAAGTVTIESYSVESGTVTVTTDFDVSAIITKGGPNARVCLADGDEDGTPLEDGDAVEFDSATFRTPINPQNGKRYGLSHVSFCYDVQDEEPPNGGNGDRECFENSTTYHVGFRWWLPAAVGNEVQSDSVGFDLGFYTEQCRHNDSPEQ